MAELARTALSVWVTQKQEVCSSRSASLLSLHPHRHRSSRKISTGGEPSPLPHVAL